MRRLMALLAVCGMAASTPTALAATAAPGLGGFSVRAQAAPVTVQLWEPVLPTPTEPQGELSFSYTRSTMDTGPSTRALASSLWPGETLGEGLGTVIGQEDAEYPIKIVASYPGGESEASQEAAPGVGMNANAAESRATARAQLKASAGDDEPDGELVATARSMSSTSEVSRTTSAVSALADAAAGDLALLGGLIMVEGVRLRSTATSDGAKGTTGGTVSVTGLRIADQQVRLGENGLGTGEDQDTEIPDQPAPVAALLETIGITVRGARSTANSTVQRLGRTPPPWSSRSTPPRSAKPWTTR